MKINEKRQKGKPNKAKRQKVKRKEKRSQVRSKEHHRRKEWVATNGERAVHGTAKESKARVAAKAKRIKKTVNSRKVKLGLGRVLGGRSC